MERAMRKNPYNLIRITLNENYLKTNINFTDDIYLISRGNLAYKRSINGWANFCFKYSWQDNQATEALF